MVSTQDVIDNYFKGERIIYFQQSDALASIGGETYLRYQKNGGIQLWFGSGEGEVCILFTNNGEILERTLRLLMYLQ